MFIFKSYYQTLLNPKAIEIPEKHEVATEKH